MNVMPGRTRKRRCAWAAVLVIAPVLTIAAADAQAFDTLDSLWPGSSAARPADARKPLTRIDIERIRRGAHDEPLRALTHHEQALLQAAGKGDLAAVKQALAAGVNVSVRSQTGDNALALALAVRGAHFETVRELLARGAWPSGKAADGFTPLSAAAMLGHAPMTRALLRAGARPDERSDNRNTALANAAISGHAAVARELMEYGADPVVPNRDGQPALIAAAAGMHADFLRVLLDYGADPNVLDREGRTALFWALLREHRQNVELLLARGSDPALLPVSLCVWFFDPKLSACR